jgi:ABC-type microcin C transport system duplicated ATPase subunit YejF
MIRTLSFKIYKGETVYFVSECTVSYAFLMILKLLDQRLVTFFPINTAIESQNISRAPTTVVQIKVRGTRISTN